MSRPRDPDVVRPGGVRELLATAGVDFAPTPAQPKGAGVVFATIVAIAGSLAVDAILVAIGTRVFPSTKGFVHFRFSDYAKLTISGVLVACAGWPVVTRITSTPRALFFRLAVLVTLVLWIPDVYIWVQHEPGRAVLVLMAMHLAIALVTYNALVHLAPIRPSRSSGRAHAAASTPRRSSS